METQNQLQIREKKFSIGGVLCLVTALVMCVTCIVSLIANVVEAGVYIYSMVEYSVSSGTDTVGGMLFMTNGIEMLVLQLSAVILGLAELAGAATLAVMGIFIIKQIRTKKLVVFPIVQIALSLLSLLVMLATPVLTFIVQILFNSNLAIGNLLSAELAGLLPHVCMALSWAAFGAVVLIFVCKGREPKSGAVAVILAVVMAVLFGGSSAMSFVAAVLNTLWGVLINLLSGAMLWGIWEYALRFIVENILSILGSAVSSGLVGICLAVTMFFVTKWVVAPFKKNKNAEEKS